MSARKIMPPGKPQLRCPLTFFFLFQNTFKFSKSTLYRIWLKCPQTRTKKIKPTVNLRSFSFFFFFSPDLVKKMSSNSEHKISGISQDELCLFVVGPDPSPTPINTLYTCLIHKSQIKIYASLLTFTDRIGFK